MRFSPRRLVDNVGAGKWHFVHSLTLAATKTALERRMRIEMWETGLPREKNVT